MNNIETDRLILSEFALDDAPFILEMLNDPAWLQFIGDRGIRTLDDARDYIVNKLQKGFNEQGFGMLIVKIHIIATNAMTMQNPSRNTFPEMRALPPKCDDSEMPAKSSMNIASETNIGTVLFCAYFCVHFGMSFRFSRF